MFNIMFFKLTPHFNSGGVRQNLYPVDGSHDSTAVAPKPDFLRHAQPGRLRRRTHRRSLVVPPAQRVTFDLSTGTLSYVGDDAMLKSPLLPLLSAW